jgi:hypothetical protein
LQYCAFASRHPHASNKQKRSFFSIIRVKVLKN